MAEIKELSIDTWITILSSEINWNREHLYHEATLSAALASIITAFAYFAIVTEDNLLRYGTLFIIIICSPFTFLSMIEGLSARKRIDRLNHIREYAIHHPQNLKEIREKWQAYKKRSITGYSKIFISSGRIREYSQFVPSR